MFAFKPSRGIGPRFSAIAILAFCLGCSGTTRVAPVNSSVARDALKTALDGWKNGGAPEDLRKGSPSLTVQDLDWLAGAKLVAYELVGDGKELDMNLRVPVKLTLRTKGGKEVKKEVAYIVGTSPLITVFRDFKDADGL